MTKSYQLWLCVAAILVLCGACATPMPRAEAARRIGEFDGRTYTHPRLGITMTLPAALKAKIRGKRLMHGLYQDLGSRAGNAKLRIRIDARGPRKERVIIMITQYDLNLTPDYQYDLMAASVRALDKGRKPVKKRVKIGQLRFMKESFEATRKGKKFGEIYYYSTYVGNTEIFIQSFAFRYWKDNYAQQIAKSIRVKL